MTMVQGKGSVHYQSQKSRPVQCPVTFTLLRCAPQSYAPGAFHTLLVGRKGNRLHHLARQLFALFVLVPQFTP